MDRDSLILYCVVGFLVLFSAWIWARAEGQRQRLWARWCWWRDLWIIWWGCAPVRKAGCDHYVKMAGMLLALADHLYVKHQLTESYRARIREHEHTIAALRQPPTALRLAVEQRDEEIRQRDFMLSEHEHTIDSLWRTINELRLGSHPESPPSPAPS